MAVSISISWMKILMLCIINILVATGQNTQAMHENKGWDKYIGNHASVFHQRHAFEIFGMCWWQVTMMCWQKMFPDIKEENKGCPMLHSQKVELHEGTTLWMLGVLQVLRWYLTCSKGQLNLVGILNVTSLERLVSYWQIALYHTCVLIKVCHLMRSSGDDTATIAHSASSALQQYV